MRPILIVDDERNIVELVRLYLTKEGFEVVTAGDGEEALAQYERHDPQLVVLDLMLPKLDGWDVCRELRRRGNVPILMLTARDDDVDSIVGLELGADDYVTKPFNPRELMARVKAVLRRMQGPAAIPAASGGPVLFEGWKLDPTSRSLWDPQGREVHLTRAEFDLLVVLASRAGRAQTRDQLLDAIAGRESAPFDRTIDVLIARLRRKIEADPKSPRFILTMPGFGYKFIEAPASMPEPPAPKKSRK